MFILYADRSTLAVTARHFPLPIIADIPDFVNLIFDRSTALGQWKIPVLVSTATGLFRVAGTSDGCAYKKTFIPEYHEFEKQHTFLETKFNNAGFY